MILIEVINNVFIGNINEPAKLAGVGLATMTINLMGLAITFGFNNSMDSLIKKAKEEGQLQQCGLIRNRGMFLVTILFIPITGILIPGKSFLIAIG